MIKCPESFQNRIWDLGSIQEVVIVTMLQKPLPRRLGNWKPTVGKKKGASLGSLVPPPTTCLLQALLHASADVILLSLFSSRPGPLRKSGAQPSTLVFVCMLLPLKPTLEGPTGIEGDCGAEEQTLDLPHKSSYLASGILRGP